MSALEKSPERRFADADEFLTALEGERERLRRDNGSQTASLTPVAPLVTPTTVYPNPATYTTQSLGPINPVTGAYTAAYWDPNATGIIPPGLVMGPQGARRSPVWPWALVATLVVAAAIAVLIVELVHKKSGSTTVNVPSVVGEPKTSAQAVLQAAGLVPQFVPVSSAKPKGSVIAQTPSAAAHDPKGSIVTLTISTGPGTPASTQVPNVVNLNATAANQALRAAGFRVSPIKQPSLSVPKNSVVATVPSGGATGPRGSFVVVTISTGPPAVAVPNVVDETFANAKLLLLQDKFVVGPVVKMVSSSPAGTVLAQSPASGKAPQGSTVTLTIAEAPPNVTVPDLRGLTQDQAAAELGKLGLVPSTVIVPKSVNPQYNDEVLSEFPAHGTSVAPGTTVMIRVENYIPPTQPTGPTGPTGLGGGGSPSGAT